MPFAETTLAQFTADLSTAMLDTANVYWTVDEIHRAVNESLLYWGAMTSYWQDRGIFNTAPQTSFYDLSVELPALRSRAYTFNNLAFEIQYHLYEPGSGVAGTGMTAQFSIGQILNALARARNEFVIDTRIPPVLSTLAVPSAPSGRVTISDLISLISQVWWHDAVTGIISPLRKIDAWAEDAFDHFWTVSAKKTPFAYSTIETPQGQVQFYPPPSSSGSIDSMVVETVNYVTNPVNAATTLALPDEYALAVKYHALDSILNTDNESFDPLRAQYAKARYKAAVESAMDQPSALRARIADIPVAFDTIANLDAARPNWRNQFKRPNMAACIYDILAFSPTPDAIYSATIDVSRSAPLPAAPGDFLQVGNEELPYLFDYCRHILSFKLGGSEFTATMPLYDNFIAGAKQRNTIQSDKAIYFTPLFDQSRKEAELAVPA